MLGSDFSLLGLCSEVQNLFVLDVLCLFHPPPSSFSPILFLDLIWRSGCCVGVFTCRWSWCAWVLVLLQFGPSLFILLIVAFFCSWALCVWALFLLLLVGFYWALFIVKSRPATFSLILFYCSYSVCIVFFTLVYVV